MTTDTSTVVEETQAPKGHLETTNQEPDVEDSESHDSEETTEETSPKFAGKYNSPEELEAAYNALQKKLGDQSKEVEQARRSQPQIAEDVERQQVEKEVPQNELEEMLMFYREQKKSKHEERVSKLDSEDFESDAP